MSLSLVQDYDSDNEITAPPLSESEEESEGDSADHDAEKGPQNGSYGFPGVSGSLAAAVTPLDELKSDSSLPSAEDIFSEITGPPEFLTPAATSPLPLRIPISKSSQQAPPPGSVIEARPTRVGSTSTVSSAVNGSVGISTDMSKSEAGEGRKKIGVAMPPVEDASQLLSICTQCHVPKTFSSSHGGLVCPLCSDREATVNTEDSKKKRGVVKDKEKNKRMKGQSSHATWKSETEMQLRQTFD